MISRFEQYCFQGHTHIPGIFLESGKFIRPHEIDHVYQLGDEKCMINVGSVGQPRDGDPRSSYVIVDDSKIEFRRVEYDAQPTRAKIYAIDALDNFLGDRLLEGR